MNYLLVMEQVDRGCDRTLACGISTFEIYAENDVEALTKAREYWGENRSLRLGGEYDLRKMLLCEVAHECPIKEWEGEDNG